MEEDKLSIVKKISSRFLTHGAKSVTMDDVCGILGISKKTLYQYFPNKESLLEEVLINLFETVFKTIKEIQENKYHPIEEMYVVHKEIHTIILSNQDVFMHQLCKFYPEIQKKHFENKAENIFNCLRSNIERGIEMGVYDKDLNVEVIVRFFFTLNMGIKSHEIFDVFRQDSNKLYLELINYHIKSILSDKGRSDWNEIQTKHKFL